MRASLRFTVPVALILGGCEAGVDVAPAPDVASRSAPLAARPDASPSRAYADGAAGVRFAHPAALRVVTDHYDPTLPAHKFKHAVTLSGAAGPILRVEVWTDAEGLALDAWFEKHLAFSRAGATDVRSLQVGVAGVPAILVDQPHVHAPAQRMVTFALGGSVVRVTCLDAEDATARAVLAEVLATFDAEGSR